MGSKPPEWMERLTADHLHPRNHYVLLRRLGKAGTTTMGALQLPEGSIRFDVAEVIEAGRGTALGSYEDITDLSPGDHVIIKTEEPIGPQLRQKTTLQFRFDTDRVELVSEADIFAKLDKPNMETNDNG